MEFFLFESGLFETMFVLIFILVFGTFIFILVKGIGEWNRNNHSPKLDVNASVTAKRINVSHHHHAGDASVMHDSSSTAYYVTFQVESGDRMEFCVTGQEYGLLTEGDEGRLSFQGTRYLDFQRSRQL